MNISKFKIKLLIIPLTVLFISLMILGTAMMIQEVEVALEIFFDKGIYFVTIHMILMVLFYSFMIEQLNKRLPWSHKNRFKRLFVQFLMIFSYSTLLTIIVFYVRDNILKIPLPDVPLPLKMMVPLVEHIIVVVLLEMIEMYFEKHELQVEYAQLEREHANSKYQSLKQQLDHHFLFNNLSVLSSIIYDDVVKADQFIQELSKVYRYVINLKEEYLVKLEREIEFIDSYFFLIKIRFEEGIDLKINIPHDHMKHLLPPMTLQTLVENAIKHNKISKQSPLTIEIYTEGDYLYVKNNYQAREELLMESTNTGLNNLENKFELIAERKPSFGIENESFVAKIPLIKPEDD